MVVYTVRKYYFFPSHVTFNLLLTSMSMPKTKNWRLDLVDASSSFEHPVFYLVAWGLEIIIVRRIFCSSCLLLCAPSLIWSPSIHAWDHTVNSPFMIHLWWPKSSNYCSYHDACVLIRCIISQWSLVRLDIS
jgi:hypothetical protein